MNQVFPSNLKLEFAGYFLDKIINFKEGEEHYRLLITNSDGLTDAIETTATEKILRDLNLLIECYFFTAMSSLDALIYEIIDGFPEIKKPKKLKITYFFETNTNLEIKNFIDEFKKQFTKLFDCIYGFINDNDFKEFNKYRNFVAHKSILSTELFFNTKTIYGRGSFSELKRPIFIPKIDEKGQLGEDKLDLIDYLKKIHEKITNLHKKIKTK
jgi:hypothetical protein